MHQDKHRTFKITQQNKKRTKLIGIFQLKGQNCDLANLRNKIDRPLQFQGIKCLFTRILTFCVID